MKNIKLKIAKVLIPCGVIIFLILALQPDMMNPINHRQEEENLKEMSADIEVYFKQNQLNKHPQNPRDFGFEPKLLGVLHVPSNWDDFNEIATFEYVSIGEGVYDQNKSNIIFISKSISSRGTKVALFKDGHIEHLSTHQLK